MPAFLDAARQALAQDGSCAFIYPWVSREALLRGLEAHGLAPLDLLPVATGSDDGARCLIRAVHAATADGRTLRSEPPLRLFAAHGGYSEEALAFCPWLASRPWSWQSASRADKNE